MRRWAGRLALATLGFRCRAGDLRPAQEAHDAPAISRSLKPDGIGHQSARSSCRIPACRPLAERRTPPGPPSLLAPASGSIAGALIEVGIVAGSDTALRSPGWAKRKPPTYGKVLQ